VADMVIPSCGEYGVAYLIDNILNGTVK